MKTPISKDGSATTLDVTIYLCEGGAATSAVGPLDVFRYAGVLWNSMAGLPPSPRFAVTVASIDGGPIRCEASASIQPAKALADIGRTELIFVSSAGADFDTALVRNAGLIEWLRERHAGGVAVAGVCTGVGLLAEAGLLDEKRATTHWGAVDYFRARYPRVYWSPERMVTEAGRIYCGGGVNAAIDLSLFLVEKYCGHEEAARCAKALLLEPPRLWQNNFSVVPLKTDHRDRHIARAQEWLHENFRTELRVEELAARVAMSPRNFLRRFRGATGMTPRTYLQKLRVAAAQRLLQDDYRTIGEIACAVGYEDAAFFRGLFKRETGVSPDTYRRRRGRESRDGGSS